MGCHRVSTSASTTTPLSGLPPATCLPAKSLITEYIREELSEGRIRIASEGKLSGVHVNPIGLIPKPHRPGKWRLIVNLSAPEGHSVNDGISKELASMHYASMDDAVNTIRRLGRGTLLAKLDLKSAYRKIPVHSTTTLSLGCAGKGRLI